MYKRKCMLLLGLSLAINLLTVQAHAQVVTLVTREEANLPEALPLPPGAPGGLQRFGPSPADKGEPSGGPRILVVSPEEGIPHSVPLSIDIRFVPEGESGVNLSTLRVEYVKLFSINITDRVLPYASPEGIRIQKTQFPSGKHFVKISIADRQGRFSSRTLTIVIQ